MTESQRPDRMQSAVRAEVSSLAYVETHPTTRAADRAVSPELPVVVVGVNQEADTHAAVEWAAEQAAFRGARLLLVAVDERAVLLSTDSDVRRLAALQARLQPALSGTDVVTEVLHGSAGPKLVERAEGAALLVLGSHRRGPVARVLHSSVAAHCLTHLPCPVAVVPADWSCPINEG